jgi:hypothetical protein
VYADDDCLTGLTGRSIVTWNASGILIIVTVSLQVGVFLGVLKDFTIVAAIFSIFFLTVAVDSFSFVRDQAIAIVVTVINSFSSTQSIIFITTHQLRTNMSKALSQASPKQFHDGT